LSTESTGEDISTLKEREIGIESDPMDWMGLEGAGWAWIRFIDT
jgi:hypothetical protein